MEKIKITRKDFEAIERAFNWQLEAYKDNPTYLKEIKRQKEETLKNLEPHEFIKMSKGIPL